ncbi:ABC transporter ATP-binding protein [Eilatimonas milleporae]|uniref:Lipoprotein-releasing system ATP-binding protein n=1 Tax=Eilatimonas milleporae TaxID=911205 RepID=A0A3M0CXX6_9PROT|nr:ABC transporter ATP-binding protein [Eilatimonas milleporae]RMB08823.1 lipoprotein-releasing system ATP-binding protein [Eilatimonas milleporae]
MMAGETTKVPAMQLKGVERRFTQGSRTVEVLRHIDLTLTGGEIVALTGVSGAGKSTLLQIAGLLDHPSAGEILLDGHRIDTASEAARTVARRRHLGFVYQFHHLLPDFTALENVALAPMIAGGDVPASRKAAEDILTALGLSERLHHRPAALSGGEQQRVAIARALVRHPKVLLADEPTGNLDEATAARVLDAFLDLVRAQDVAVIIATHDQALARKTDRIVSLREGRLHQMPAGG